MLAVGCSDIKGKFGIMVLCDYTLDLFLVLLSSYSTAGNAFSTGRQCGYSMAPVNFCKSLLSAFAEGNLHFQMHEIAILHTSKANAKEGVLV